MISTELQDVLKVVRQIRGNDRDSGAHYLLGYLWANTPEKEKKRIAKLFADDLAELGNDNE
jgi:succinate dehydrogenase/fumarate reductase flavoprotein subunit